MIRINNTNWEDLTFSDVEDFLKKVEIESVYFDNKQDEASNDKIIKEICAFANTFGGYIFIGVKNDNTIVGCKHWDEERVQNIVRFSIFPIPVVDIKKLSKDNISILVIKVFEGQEPPYVTNSGKIYLRVSSASHTVKDSAELNGLIQKRNSHRNYVYRKIEAPLPNIKYDQINNLVGCIDVGASITTSSELDLFKHFNNIDLEMIAEILSKTNNIYSISKIGDSYQITIGALIRDSKEVYSLDAGLHNFLILYSDGSFCYRITLFGDTDTGRADITGIFTVAVAFEDIYKAMMGDDFKGKFVYAEKYQKLQVYRQFIPYYDSKLIGDTDFFNNYLEKHIKKYGNNKIVAGQRFPIEGYVKIDKEFFENQELEYTKESIAEYLVGTGLINLGYIDPIKK